MTMVIGKKKSMIMYSHTFIFTVLSSTVLITTMKVPNHYQRELQ